MKQITILTFAPIFLARICLAQDAPPVDDWKPSPTNQAGKQFPQVNSEGRVRFRIVAPQAQSVKVSFRDSSPFVKGEDGAWTGYTRKLDEGFHYYTITVDGAEVPDPNSLFFFGANRWGSAVEVPAKDQDFYALKNVPHGQLREIFFHSKSTNTERRAFVYTPPDYDQSAEKRYPVLYLQHGYGENEYGWGAQGHAGRIMDNLIAEGKTKPFIIVMTYGMTNDIRMGGISEFKIEPFQTVLIEELIPHVDASFRTLADQPNRAMAGLSMGGMETKTITLKNLNVFSHIGVFSGGSIAPGDIADLAAFKEKNKLVFVSYGSRELGGGNQPRRGGDPKAAVDALKAAGVNSVFYVSPDTAHEWLSWRRSLKEIAPLLFQSAPAGSQPAPAAPAKTAAAPSSQHGPIRVLFLGSELGGGRKHCHTVMRDFGRDAIWFDYADDPSVTADWIAKFDAVLLCAPAGPFPALAGVPPEKLVVEAAFSRGTGNPAPAEFLNPLKEKLLTAAGLQRRAEWEQFLKSREAEQREAKPTVANYERRPQPLTFQHPMSVKGSMERTQVAPDLRLELFAAEPDIMKPICMAWDDRGRCWVAETSDYPHGVKPGGEGNDCIKICEDTNGDGKADKFTIFADKLNIPTSLTFANGGLIVSQPPRFLFLKDTNGDDKAEVREDIITGWGIGDTHAQASNLHYGIDNWFYGCVGYSAFNGTVGGVQKRFTQGTYRFRADGSALEFLHQFTNNSWGQSANDAGDQFGGTANGAPLFYGGIPASHVPKGMRVMTAKKINTEDNVHTITPNYRQVDVMGGYTAAAGSNIVYSAKLPARLQGKALVCEPTMKTISLMDVKATGAGMTAGDGFNLVASSDEWMSPVFADVGPDGAVWFADWQNFIIQHNPTPSQRSGGYDAKTGPGGAHENDLRDHARGRIYRVVWNEAKEPAALQKLNAADPASLTAALGSDILERRLTAQRLLVEGKHTAAADGLKKLVVANDGSIAALHALWTLHGLDALDDATWNAALLAKDARLRRNAVRALKPDAAGPKLYFGSGVVSDPDLVTRLAALVKLAEFPTTPEIQTLVKKLAADGATGSDEWLREAARLLVRQHKTEARFTEGPNLLPNPGFETTGANGLPEGWTRNDNIGRSGPLSSPSTATWKMTDAAHGGKMAVTCNQPEASFSALYFEVPLKPNTEYRLTGWAKTANFSGGRVGISDRLSRVESERITRTVDWTQIEMTYNSGSNPKAGIMLSHFGKGDSTFDDVKFCELIPQPDAAEEPVAAGDAKRGEDIFWKHPVAACVNCHTLGGKGSVVGPALDGIAKTKDEAYLIESLAEPNAKLAESYKATPISPMPPMRLILKPQEFEDVKEFLKTLK
jgi:putative membrane-bound dehydrogenase-like protein